MSPDSPILLIEDDKVDSMTLLRAFSDINATNPILDYQSAENALEYLQSPEAKIPGIIVLDLNMPRMSGIEFLEILKDDEKLRAIPVIILTTSKGDYDRQTCFNLNVAGYMVKPVGYPELVKSVRTIYNYWNLSELPEGV